MIKKVQFEIMYESDIKNETKFNSDCNFKTMSLFNGIPTKGIFNQGNGQINYTINKITVK